MSGPLVPVSLGVPEEGREDDRKQNLTVIADETHYVIIAPIIERSLCHLTWRKMKMAVKNSTKFFKCRVGLL